MLMRLGADGRVWSSGADDTDDADADAGADAGADADDAGAGADVGAGVGADADGVAGSDARRAVSQSSVLMEQR